MIGCEDQLNTMDSGSGDSDCGSTLRRGAEAILNKIKHNPDLALNPTSLLHDIATVAEKDMGGKLCH